MANKGLFDDIPVVGESSSFSAAGMFDDIPVNKSFLTKLEEGADDFKLSLMSGIASVPEIAIGLADIPTKGKAGKYVEEELGFSPKKIKESLHESLSDETKDALKATQEAEGFWNTLAEAVKNPRAVGQIVTESGPLMVAGGGIGKGISAIPGLVGKISPWVAGAIGEGVVGTGLSAEQTRQQTDDGLLTGAQSTAAVKSGISTGLISAVGGRIAKKYGFDDVDTMLASGKNSVPKEIGDRIAKSPAEIGKRIFGGGVVEGFEELTQESQEQIWQNAALGRPLDAGVSNAAALGFLSGVGMGTGVNVATSGKDIKAVLKKDEEVTPFEGTAEQTEDLPIASEEEIAKMNEVIVPDKVFTSKKGNYYERVNEVWFDSEGEEVTNEFKLKAAEKGAKDYVPPKVEESEQLFQGVAEQTKDLPVAEEGELVNQKKGNVQQIEGMFDDIPVISEGVTTEEIADNFGTEVQLEPEKGFEQFNAAKAAAAESNKAGVVNVEESSEQEVIAETQPTTESLAENKSNLPDITTFRIKEAALKLPDGTIFTGPGHIDALDQITKEKYPEFFDAYGMKDDIGIISGFIGADNKFYTDKEVKKITGENEIAMARVAIADANYNEAEVLKNQKEFKLKKLKNFAEQFSQKNPGMEIKFDDVYDRSKSGKPPLYQFTPTGDKYLGQTIAVEELSEEAISEKLKAMKPLDENTVAKLREKERTLAGKKVVGAERSNIDEMAEEERVYYHGSKNTGITSFDLDLAGTATDYGFSGTGIYFSKDKSFAEKYAVYRGGNLYTVKIDLKNPLTDINILRKVQEKVWSTDVDSKTGAKQIRDALVKLGYDGVDTGKEVVVYDPEKIKILKEEKTKPSSGVILTSGVDPIKAVKDTIQLGKDALDYLKTPGPVTENLKKTGKAVKEQILDPERIMKQDPEAKKAFFELVNAEENKNAFLYRNYEEFKKATKGIKRDSFEAKQIGKALDGQITPDQLTKNERKAYDFFKANYEALITEYAQRTAGSKEAYDRILNVVKNGTMKKTLVKDLVGEDKLNYWRLREEINQVRKGKKNSELSEEELRNVDALKAEQRSILHNDWRSKLPPNEADVYDILSRKVNDYLPRMFDPDELKATFKAELADARKKLAKTTNKAAETKLKNTINKYEKALKVMNGGGMVTFDQLPGSVFFKFFSPRTGKTGYSFDAMKAYESYLFGIAKKMFDEPAAKKIGKEYYDKIEDPDLKRYTKDLVKHYLGMDKSKFDWLAGQITTFEWMRTLGLNPRSALVNLSQRLNTVMYAGEKYSILAQHEMDKEFASLEKYKSEAAKAFEESGIAREVPNVMTEGDTPGNLEGLKSIVGVMFNTVELSNRKHAFMAGYMKAKASGATDEKAAQQGQKTVHKTQFRYGKLGMPKIYWNPAARVGLQFSSYTLKQAQFLYDMTDGFKTKEGLLRLMKYIGYTTGIQYGLKELLDADMSSAIGVNISWADAFAGIKSLVEGEWQDAARHFKMSVNDGQGIVPSLLGPAPSGVWNVKEKAEQGKGVEQFIKELTPVIVDRVKQFVEAEKRPDGTYVVKGQSDNAIYNLTQKQLIQRTIGPKSAEETRVQRLNTENRMLELERKGGLTEIVDAFIDGDEGKLEKVLKSNQDALLIAASQKGLLQRMIVEELKRRSFTGEELSEMKKPGASELYRVLKTEEE